MKRLTSLELVLANNLMWYSLGPIVVDLPITIYFINVNGIPIKHLLIIVLEPNKIYSWIIHFKRYITEDIRGDNFLLTLLSPK